MPSLVKLGLITISITKLSLMRSKLNKLVGLNNSRLIRPLIIKSRLVKLRLKNSRLIRLCIMTSSLIKLRLSNSRLIRLTLNKVNLI